MYPVMTRRSNAALPVRPKCRLATWYLAAALSTAVTAALLATASPPAGAGPLSGLPSLPVPSLPTPSLPVPVPTLTPPPLPTLSPPPLPVPPGTGPPTAGAPVPVPPPAGVPAPGAGGGTNTTTTTDTASVIAGDPAADLYPQPPVDPATTPQSQLVVRLGEVERRMQYLHNVLVRTRADLAAAHAPVDPVVPLIALLTAPAEPSSAATLAGRVRVLSAAVASGEAELARRELDAQALRRQVDDSLRPTLTSAPANSVATGYSGGKLRRPVPGPVTSPFGNRFDPYYHVWQLHAGLDMAAGLGSPIVAAAGGRVTQAGWSGGYGNYTCVDHGQVAGQRLSTCYGHQQAILVAPGQLVSAGQVIGKVGSTGASTGPHLHFEVRLGGRPVDPAPWLS
jgi:murein DD-endopeptidase MepM/ murein hydrolase activator NlpD